MEPTGPAGTTSNEGTYSSDQGTATPPGTGQEVGTEYTPGELSGGSTGQVGTTGTEGTPGTTNSGISPEQAESYRQEAMRANGALEAFRKQYSDAYLAQAAQNLKAQGVPDEIVQGLVQSRLEAETYKGQLAKLAASPAIRQLAAEKAAGPFLKDGVKPEELLDAPSPEAMMDRARTLANERRKAGLVTRRQSGADSVEGVGAGSGSVNLDKLSGLELIRLGLQQNKKKR